MVDDDATVRELVARHLERAGFAVVAARGGQEGLRLVRELRPAAVTLDIMMPDLDGWTVLAAIKGDPALAGIPVVLMSIVEQKNRGYALGAADYLVKPVDRTKLVETLTGICGSTAGRALLVDDDEVVRRGVRQALEPIGWTGDRGGERPRRGRALTAARPDVIILDLMMPKMDGFEFLDELRETARVAGHPGRGHHREGPDGRGPRPPQRRRRAHHSKERPRRNAASTQSRDKQVRQVAGGEGGMKILYVEDNDDNIYMLKNRLDARRLHASSSPPTGRRAWPGGREQPDLVLMDLTLPVSTAGGDAPDQGRRRTRSRIPIIALTAHAMPGDEEKAMAAGCDDFDTKPVELQRLLGKIRRWRRRDADHERHRSRAARRRRHRGQSIRADPTARPSGLSERHHRRRRPAGPGAAEFQAVRSRAARHHDAERERLRGAGGT